MIKQRFDYYHYDGEQYRFLRRSTGSGPFPYQRPPLQRSAGLVLAELVLALVIMALLGLGSWAVWRLTGM